ncbi:hypothetical protein [Vibrio phage LP.1]|nr:hypothetical protein [Vibrio phage LP.1]
MTKMTVKEFLDSGYEFVEGDVFGSAYEVRDITVGEDCSVEQSNTPEDEDGKRLIIKAAALENTTQEWDGEGLPPVGVECMFDNYANKSPLYGHDDFGTSVEIVAVLPDENCCVARLSFGLGVFDASFFRPLETQQQREEREQLEAAYDLYKSGMIAVNANYCDFSGFIMDYSGVYLALVEKTGYRVTK